MLITVDAVDRFGVVKDVKPHLLPLNAWTDARNVRFRDGKITKMRGQTVVFNPPSVAPYWLLNGNLASGSNFWMYAGLAAVYIVSGGVHTDITRAVGGAYSAAADTLWNGGSLQGVPVINNSVDVPQYWASPLSAGTDLANLLNWPAAHRCFVMRPFKSFLFAMDMVESGTRIQERVRISHPADPGAVPSSWDETDPTTDSIKKDLTDKHGGPVIDGLGLGDIFVVYKQKSTHGFQFIGGRFKWRNYEIFGSSGLMAKNCVTSFDEGRQHFAVTGEDVIVHNTQQRTSVIDKRELSWLRNNLSPTRFNRSFVVPNLSEGEVWFCFPTGGNDWPNIAMIWNRQSNSITFRDIDLASFIELGLVQTDTSSDVWDTDSQPWDLDLTTWDQFSNPTFVSRLLQSKPDTTKFLHLETTEQFDGVSFEAVVERTGISAFGMDRGQVVSDTSMWKLVKQIYPRAKGGPIEVQVGTQDAIESGVTWSPSEIFVPGQERPCCDFEVPACRLWGVRFRTIGDTSWELEGYDADVEPLGRF